MVQDATAAAQKLGIELPVLWASNEHEIDAAFTAMSKLGVAALVIPPDAFFNSHVARLCASALRQRIAIMAPERAFVDAGGLMSYGGHLDEGFYIAGNYLGRILKGEQPADMPVQQSTRLTFAINLKAAKTLGLTVPPLVLGQADEVIE
jgi:putative ABC transport system substrate-binding protein